MKSQNIQEMSNEDLLKRKKTAEVATGMLVGSLAVLLAVALYLCFKQGVSVGLPFIGIALGLSPIVFLNFTSIKAVKKELQTRNLLS